MRGLFCLTVMMCLLTASVSFAEFSGTLNNTYQNQRSYEEGERVFTKESFLTNLSLNLNRRLTSFVFYQIYLRAHYKTTDRTDASGRTTTQITKNLEPSFQISLSTPFYQFRLQYRLNLRDTEAFTGRQTKTSDELFSVFFNLTPQDLPSLYLQFYRERIRNRLYETGDRDNYRYIASSYYKYQRGSFSGEYYITYQNNTDKTPDALIYRTETRQFSASYKVSYNTNFWREFLRLYGEYKGNLGRTRSNQFSSETGEFLFEREPFEGLYAVGTLTEPEVEFLPSEPALIDNDLETGISRINLSTTRYHNIGLSLLTEEPVEKIYIYVNRDVTGDPNLQDPANWKVFISDLNFTGAEWTEVPVATVTVTVYDPVLDIYRYEIELSSTQTAKYFKVVNYETVFGVSDVLVTEIEAYGTELITSREVVSVSKFYQQEIHIGAGMRIRENLNLDLSLYTKRMDTNMPSLKDSAGKVFKNIFSDPSVDLETEQRVEVTRSYSATLRWDPYSNLSSQARLQRFELVDNKGEKDHSANSFSLQLQYIPLQRLTTTLTLTRSESYEFDEKRSRNTTLTLTTDAKILRQLTMITDIGYHLTDDLIAGTETRGRFITGSLDVHFTNQIRSYITFGLERTSSEEESTTTKRASLTLNYRPGRTFTLSGNFSISDTEGDTTTSEGISLNWRPTRKLWFNLGASNSHREPDSIDTQSLHSSFTWYMRRFLDLRLTYSFNRQETDVQRQIHTLRLQLNCRI